MKDKVALIGNGYWGSKLKKYIPYFFDMKYIADSKFPLKKIWKDPEVKHVFIATPIDTHYKIAKKALLSGKNVFLEKPISRKAREAESLIRIAEERDLVLVVDYVLLFSRTLAKIMAFFRKKEINYIEMQSKHLGKYNGYSVYWLLSSHFLPIIGYLYGPLSNFRVIKEDLKYWGGVVTTGILHLEHKKEKLVIKIFTSLDYPGKELSVNFYGTTHAYIFSPHNKDYSGKVVIYDHPFNKTGKELILMERKFHDDESNNLKYAIDHFYTYILTNNKSFTTKLALDVTALLERLDV